MCFEIKMLVHIGLQSSSEALRCKYVSLFMYSDRSVNYDSRQFMNLESVENAGELMREL